MRTNINLASQKYEDVRQLYLRLGTATALLAVMAVALALLVYANYFSTRRSTERISALRAEVNGLERQKAELLAVQNSPENHDVNQQKDFWNDQIYLRSLSWTQLLTDLEKIMPQRAYLEAVQPSLTPDYRLKLDMIIAGESHENGLELIRKMEKSERFKSPGIRTEGPVSQHGKPTVWKFQVETYYTSPAPSHTPASGTKEGF